MLFLKLFLLIITLSQDVLLVDVKKLYYEKDLSEYCKRRVIPSIFLGSQVVEASAFILHFTKLNLPYSCFISIRSEAGNNLIMALTLPNEEDLEKSCSANSPQLLVYEIGETFGGYWGMLPESLVKPQPPQKPKYYTLKTTQASTTATEPSTEYTEPTTTQTTTVDDSEDSNEFIRVEVPLVEVSGHLVPGSEQPTTPFDVAAAFDYLYDVTPIPGVKYDTSILPLVQLSVRKQNDSGRRDGQEPRYEIDVIEEFTPDPRLPLPHLKPNNKHKVDVNRHMSVGRKSVTKNKRRKNFRITTTKNSKHTKYVFPTTITTKKRDLLTRNSWEIIDQLMEKLRRNKDNKRDRINIQKNTSDLAENISNMKTNYSIYLQPNLSVYNVSESEMISPATPEKISSLYARSSIHQSKKSNLKHKETKSTKMHEKESQNIHRSSQNISKITMQKITSSSSTTSQFIHHTTSIESLSHKTNVIKMESNNNVISQTESSEFSVIGLPNTVPPVSLLDHESWENIVQVAPSMAVILNQTASHNVNSDRSSLNETHRKTLLQRKKRSIQAIEIQNARPHSITTRMHTSSTTKRPFNVADMQEFARMVELKDDEVHGRVALRYLRQYVGPAIYNICGDPHLHNRHVYLFNSSRIVLSLQNFSLSSISVILTGARTLLSNEMKCPSTQLECQVSGARVCVDSLAACDGVPNCGSYDIYDEDRLMCGVALGLRRYVYLASFTFLALLLTLCYAVHYWLKRCVPKVAEAFFVYTDGIENILYLDSIMRPPGDMEDGSTMFYRGSGFRSQSAEFMNEPKNILRSRQTCIQLLRKLFSYCQKKKAEEDIYEHEHEMFAGDKKTFSFTQMELSNISQTVKFTADTSVQTGESLEIAIFDKHKDMNMKSASNEANYQRNDSRDPPIMINDSLITLDEPLPEDELSLMKFFRDSRSDSNDSIKIGGNVKMDFNTGAAPSREIEISSITYDGLLNRPGPSGVKVKPKTQTKIGQTRKRLRFNEVTTTIPTVDLSDDEDEIEYTRQRRQAVGSSIQNRSWRAQHLSTIKEDDEAVGKHRHFWESKGKKSSKKANASLR